MRKIAKVKLRLFIKEYTGLFSFIVLMVFFRSAVADWYTVPTGSMQPTIEIGDRVVVNKMAYDLKVPLTNITLTRMSEPNRGDIIVFESKAAENRLIKRVIGLPGDKVSMTNEVLTINGKRLNYTLNVTENHGKQTLENLVGLKHIVKHDPTKNPLMASFNTVTVPADHYLVLGDNRRNSADSRVYGFVPREELKGKAHHVAFSLNYENYYLPKTHRFLKNLYAL
ncbi:signal peptidase I [Colwellia sp. UCD-KL20]|uniref:signal peptidase I n=1 Tax=Colwellia sp. UCD-KL20 TaxID=1917165 RepID=UPI000971478D|nr:signal peptidase I [Colwellia sp. UCD-KL20]